MAPGEVAAHIYGGAGLACPFVALLVGVVLVGVVAVGSVEMTVGCCPEIVEIRLAGGGSDEQLGPESAVVVSDGLGEASGDSAPRYHEVDGLAEGEIPEILQPAAQ